MRPTLPRVLGHFTPVIGDVVHGRLADSKRTDLRDGVIDPEQIDIGKGPAQPEREHMVTTIPPGNDQRRCYDIDPWQRALTPGSPREPASGWCDKDQVVDDPVRHQSRGEMWVAPPDLVPGIQAQQTDPQRGPSARILLSCGGAHPRLTVHVMRGAP